MHHHVSLALWSKTLTPSEISSRIGLPPDEWLERGARQKDPPIPVQHKWAIVCGDPNMRPTQQTRVVLDRIKPFEEQVQELIAADDCAAVLQLVRFYDADSEGRGVSLDPSLLGFRLDSTDIALLARLSATLDCDELL
jgi:hypothetical protein